MKQQSQAHRLALFQVLFAPGISFKIINCPHCSHEVNPQPTNLTLKPVSWISAHLYAYTKVSNSTKTVQSYESLQFMINHSSITKNCWISMCCFTPTPNQYVYKDRIRTYNFMIISHVRFPFHHFVYWQPSYVNLVLSSCNLTLLREARSGIFTIQAMITLLYYFN